MPHRPVKKKGEFLNKNAPVEMELLCGVCEKIASDVNLCEDCGKEYGPCCNSLREGTCVQCSDGGSD